MNILKDIEPASVMHLFEALCDLPRGSRNTKTVSDFCAVFARVRGYDCRQDKANNLVIRAEASRGYEDHPAVILQAHLDMVCERTADTKIDFQRDGLSLVVDEDYIRASGTTLGADDGIGVAFLLALLDNKNLPHPPMEILLTTDEEIGMLGAVALDTSSLTGRRMINIDSENEGVLTVGCAGGVKSTLTLPLQRESVTGTPYAIQISGLVGGHSGTEIDKGHTNAILLGADLLARYSEGRDLRLIGFNGGGKDNAIPRSATLKFITATPLSEAEVANLETLCDTLRPTEPDVAVTFRVADPTSLGALTRESTDRVLRFFAEIPRGIQKMSAEVPGLVQTSLNLGILSFERSMCATFSLRSSVDREREELAARLSSVIRNLGGQYAANGTYPAWEYRQASPLRDTMLQVYRNLYGAECRTDIIHAGLECGILSSKIRDLDCVSFGPTILDIHTPREALSISSVARTWNYLTETLKAL